jgi:hypothetical protein
MYQFGHQYWGVSDHVWLGVLCGGGVLWAILGLIFAGRNGNGCWGCFLGAILGPVGLLISLLIPPARRL